MNEPNQIKLNNLRSLFLITEKRKSKTNNAIENTSNNEVCSQKMSSRKTYKVAIFGETGSGKSALAILFVRNEFIEIWDPTI